MYVKEEINSKYDNWGFGVLIYYMLSGKYPFKKDKDKLDKGFIRKDVNKFLYNYEAVYSEQCKVVLCGLLDSNYESRFNYSNSIFNMWLYENNKIQAVNLPKNNKLTRKMEYSNQIKNLNRRKTNNTNSNLLKIEKRNDFLNQNKITVNIQTLGKYNSDKNLLQLKKENIFEIDRLLVSKIKDKGKIFSSLMKKRSLNLITLKKK